MPKAPRLESGRAGTHLQVCGTLPPGSASAADQPCVALDRSCSSQPPALLPMLMEATPDTKRGQGHGPGGLARSSRWKELGKPGAEAGQAGP